MNFGLTDEQQMVVNTVRGFVEKELYPLEADVERTGHVPLEVGREIQRKVKALGFYAPNIPEEFGGGGLDNLTFALLERELGRTTWALHVWWGRPSNILCAGNAEQRARYLAPSVRGEKVDALAISEPDAGSDIRGMRGATGRRRLGHQRHEALHQPCGRRRFRDSVCEHRRRDGRWPGQEAHHVLPCRQGNA